VAPLTDHIDVGTWTWICMVHQPKTFWRDRVLFYQDGRLVTEVKAAYPTSAAMRPVSTATVGGFEGQLASCALFGTDLTTDDVKTLWEATSSPSMGLKPPPTHPLRGRKYLPRSMFHKVLVRGGRGCVVGCICAGAVGR